MFSGLSSNRPTSMEYNYPYKPSKHVGKYVGKQKNAGGKQKLDGKVLTSTQNFSFQFLFDVNIFCWTNVFANVLGMLSTRSNFSWPTSCELIGQLKFERVETIQNMLEIMLANKKRWCQTKIGRKSSDIDPELFCLMECGLFTYLVLYIVIH